MFTWSWIRAAPFGVLLFVVSACSPPTTRPVGEFSNDLLGNQIEIQAFRDPDVPGVMCHFANFDRGVLDRVTNGNWFEDPSNASISCLRVGAINLSKATLGPQGKEIFSEKTSLFFKATAVRRIVDQENASLIYVAHGRELVRGSAKMNISTVALTPEDMASLGKP